MNLIFLDLMPCLALYFPAEKAISYHLKELVSGEQVVIDHIGAEDAFGEMALIDDAPRSATIRITCPRRFPILHKQEFKETAMEFPRIALQICSVLSQRIRTLHEKFQSDSTNFSIFYFFLSNHGIPSNLVLYSLS